MQTENAAWIALHWERVVDECPACTTDQIVARVARDAKVDQAEVIEWAAKNWEFA